ncbi:MAG: ATP-binding cassette domain-containing protein [Planctomycetota bacterium]
MPLVTAQNLSIGYRGPSLLNEVDFQIESGQRIGLLGRNGAGKTTLMKLIHGNITPDSGNIQVHSGVHVSMLRQDVPRDISSSAFDVVRHGLDSPNGRELEEWQVETEVEKILSRMDLDRDLRFESLSSGMKRRVLLAQALVSKPDLLLLDEPTNHLDIDSIGWLETFLLKQNFSILFVTHDRMFLRKLSNRIFEIDRGRLFDWSCDYDKFLQRKQDALAAEEKQNALFDKRLAEEEAWIRKGIKARRTRNEGRVRALKEMRQQRSERRTAVGTSNLQIQEARKSGQLVIEADSISFAFDENIVFEDFSTDIMRGDKVGVIGPNGAGKTTLLKTLLGEIQPTAGQIKQGTNLEVAYFDQLRQQLDPEQTVLENVSQGADSIVINGTKKHLLGYLQDFLFSPERARTQVKFLSGGEQNRILLAKLFTQPANMIVLDEPTNDLDAETLELLEERLVQFSGTVLMVSHDREFLNNVVTSTIVFEPDGLKEFVGGYDDWQRQSLASQAAPTKSTADESGTDKKKEKSKPARDDQPRKLSYKEKRELESLPERIEDLESKIESIHQQMAQPDFYQQAGTEIAAAQDQLKTLESELVSAYERWEELESFVAG